MDKAKSAKNETAIVICQSIHDVIHAERVVKEHGMWCDLIPTPREVSSDCGMALEINLNRVEQLIQLQEAEQLRISAVFRRANSRFERIHGTAN